MIENIISGILSVFTFETFSAIAFGTFVGLMFGAIPGISGIMAISILLPLTFYVSPLVGIPMLLGIYKSSFFGGSITAILLNTPGAPPAVCTAMDGYPLAKQGKAGKALNAALVGSVFGDTFSNILLMVIATPLSYLALKVGPVEQFCLLILALTVVGSISEHSITKGLISAGLGILLATVGISGTSGATRFTFGSENLGGGFAFIPMVIGLLCLPEVIHQASVGVKKHIIEKFDLKGENGTLSWKEIKKATPLLFRSSLIGCLLGAMPGLGAAPAAFLAYSEARRTSKTPEKFGTGMIEGVLAPESANNAVTGSAMIPLLTLGIPGDDVTAVLMGAFLIQGLTPGPNIFFEQTTILYGIFASLIICDIMLYIIAKFSFRVWVKIAQLPKYIIFSGITIFSFIGAYSINQNLFDIFCLIMFGILGYFMRHFGFAAGPMIIGFILCPFLELTFEQILNISNNDMTIIFKHPVAVVLLILASISVISIIRIRKRGSSVI